MKISHFSAGLLLAALTVVMVQAGPFTESPQEKEAAETNADPEPPLVHRIRIGDQEITLEPGKEIKVEGTFTNPSIVLLPAEARTFSAAGIRFDYPSRFKWSSERDEESDLRTWTMEGSDAMVMVQAHPMAKISPDDVVGASVEQFRKMNAKVSQGKSERTFGGVKHQGVHMRGILALGVEIYQECYAFRTGAGGTLILTLQDSREDGKVSREFTELCRLLEKSFVLPKKEKKEDAF
jgi:hypothetical protein